MKLRTPSLLVLVTLALAASPGSAWILGQPHMTVSPLYLDFQHQVLGTVSDSFWVDIHNEPGGSDLSFSVSLQGADAGYFQLACDGGGSGCLSGWIPPGQSRYVLVSFAPVDAGPHQAEILVSGTDSTNPNDIVELVGTGADLVFADGFEIGDAGSWSTCGACFF